MSRQTEHRVVALERAQKPATRLLPCFVTHWPHDGTDDEQRACQEEIDAAKLTHEHVIVVRRAGTEIAP